MRTQREDYGEVAACPCRHCGALRAGFRPAARTRSFATGIIIIHLPPLANLDELPICGAPACRRRPLKKDENRMRVSKPHGAPERNPDLNTLYQSVREASARLGAPLSDADATVQSMPDASPAKWHLAHTTWFFERMILEPNLPGYRAFDPQFNFLFNSYYESIGARQPRPRRGMITRPRSRQSSPIATMSTARWRRSCRTIFRLPSPS